MKQSSWMSFVESTINILVGFGIACVAQAIFLPMLGVPIPWDANLAFAAIMTVISIARSFVLRRVFEALHIRRPLSPFMQAVIAERYRQIEVKGYDPANDNALEPGELARAGAAYAIVASGPHFEGLPLSDAAHPAMQVWPWPADPMRPRWPREDLARAGALIIAEGERLDRQRKHRPDSSVLPFAAPSHDENQKEAASA